MSIHAAVMTIKDRDEGIRIVAERRRPVQSLVSCRSHFQYCPHQSKRYMNRDRSRRLNDEGWSHTNRYFLLHMKNRQ
jgi:hypothetical protein